MSGYYDPPSWQAPVRPWDQPVPPSRSGMACIWSFGDTRLSRLDTDLSTAGSSSVSQRDEPIAFASQFEGMESILLTFVSAIPG